MTWSEFLTYAAGPGVSIVVGALLSVLVEEIPSWDSLEARVKRAVTFFLCLSVPVLASVLGVISDDWLLNWDQTFWPALVAGFTAFTASQVIHVRKL